MILHPLYVGCDISKHAIDIHDPSGRGARRIANTLADCSAFAVRLAGTGAMVVMEASGSYDGSLRQALALAGVAYARVNPTRARRFAQAAGYLAKTDAVDARMLAHLGASLRPAAETPLDTHRKALADLHKRRDQLVSMRADEKKRAHEADDIVLASIHRHVAWLSAEIDDLQQRIAALLEDCGQLKAHAGLLRTAPGIGPAAAIALTALMPELGALSPKQVASLAGLAPVNNDSGAFRGMRRIKAGRRRVRQALYMAALAAIRACPRFTTFYKRIRNAGKAAKLAIIAVARKLLTVLNAMVRDNRAFA